MLSVEKMKELTGGAIISEKSPLDYDYAVIAGSVLNNTNYPATFRLWTSGVKDQKNKNSCVAHACATLKETQEYYDSGDKIKFSVGWIYGHRDRTHYQGAGMIVREAFANLLTYGAVHESFLPDNLEFKDIQTIIEDRLEVCLEAAKDYKIESYAGIDPKMSNRVNAIKSALYNDHSPVVANYCVYDSFYDIDDTAIMPKPNKKVDFNYGGHAVAIIGWTTIGDKEYWVIQNSWGEYFGDNGCFYAPVGEEDEYGFVEFWCSVDIANYNLKFNDIKGRWSEDYINKCVRAGLISGFEDGSFRPTDTVTREQLCVILTKLMQKS